MELIIHFTALPEKLTLDMVKSDLAELLEELAGGGGAYGARRELEGLAQRFRRLGYARRSHFHLPDGQRRFYYLFALLFQRLSYLLADEDWGRLQAGPACGKVLVTLAGLVRQLQNAASPEARGALTERLQILLAEGEPRTRWPRVPWREVFASGRRRLSLNNFEVRFALRLAVVMTISTTVSLLWEFEHTYWFPLHAFLLLQPSYEESAHRMITRPVGTAIGCLVVHLVYPWLPGLTGVFAFALAMISLMYCCTPGSWVHPIFSTSFALALATLTVKEGQAIQLRLFYLLLAVALVLVVNRFLVPTRKATQFRHNLRTLCRLQASYWEMVQRSLHAPGRPERSGEILACFHLVYHEAAQYAAALPAGEAERYRTVLLTLWNLFAHVEQVECLVLTGELGEEEYPVLSRLAGEIQELLDPPRPALAELGLEGLPASGALCRAMERYRHNARLLLEAWEKQPVSC